ncbi:MAG: inorganic diphosphatase [Clostridiales bacterium]|nr:inorganic diphosphatase [Clostridiales bacterium]
MNIWKNISDERIKPDRFIVIIEIAAGSKTKYEIDRDTGYIILDRILYTSTQYPANYGFIPKTLSGDDDPLDVLVLCQERLDPLVLVECIPIGAIIMIDEEEVDEKIVAVPINDPSFNTYKDIHELPPHIMDEFSHFFARYKELEDKETSVQKVLGREASIEIVEKSIKRYKKTQ